MFIFVLEPNLFGLYLSLSNRNGIVELQLYTHLIFRLYLHDVFEFIENNSEYLSANSQAGGNANAEEFIFVDILLYDIFYDSVRIRTWNWGGGDVLSDNHVIGRFTSRKF